jgi:hypothetical protein
MPAPDPMGIELGPDWPELVAVLAHHFPVWAGHSGGNRRHRIARAVAILRNLKRGGWLCLWCKEPVPIYAVPTLVIAHKVAASGQQGTVGGRGAEISACLRTRDRVGSFPARNRNKKGSQL